MSIEPATLDPKREPRWRVISCLLLTILALQLTVGQTIRLPLWSLNALANPNVAEAAAWLNGRLDIDAPVGPDEPRRHDTAWVDGRVYSVYPPYLTFLSFIGSPLFKLMTGRADAWPQLLYVAVVFWPLPIIAFFVFRRRVGDSAWAGFLTVSYIGGTAVVRCLHAAKFGEVCYVNHVCSQVGLLLLTDDLLNRRRIWPALIGLAIAAWSRQLTLLYAGPILWYAAQRGRLLPALAAVCTIILPFGLLHYLKYGSPFDSGYAHLYVGRDDIIAQRFHEHGLFSWRYLPFNVWYANFAWPELISTPSGLWFTSNKFGTSIWITTPMLAFIAIGADTWRRNRPACMLVVVSLLVMLAGLLYHYAGYAQIGISRYALDFIPVWLVVAAPATRGGWRTWLSLGFTGWSLLYFQSILAVG